MSMNSNFGGHASGEVNVQAYKIIGSKMNEKWLRCSLFKGMFSDEVAIKIEYHGATTSVFVPKEFTRGKIGEEGTVKVMVFTEGNTAWAVLPNAQQVIIPVNDQDLVATS